MVPIDLGSVSGAGLDALTCDAHATPPPASPSPDAGPPEPAACHDVSIDGAPYVQVTGGATPPTLAGGTITDGTYLLTAAAAPTSYGDDDRLRAKIVIAGATWKWVFAEPYAAPETASGELTYEAHPNTLRLFSAGNGLDLQFTRQ